MTPQTFNQIHASRILDNITLECMKISGTLSGLKQNYIDCKITARNAKKEYIKQIQRAVFYCSIARRIADKYFEVDKIKYYQISDFSEFIAFFE